MPINSIIEDGKGSGEKVYVKDHGLLIHQIPEPPLIHQKCKIFRQNLTDDGTATGTSSMLVSSGNIPKKFYIEACETCDRYIMSLSFEISDALASLNEFGHVPPLTNGCQLYYEDIEHGTVYIHDSLKTNWDFVRMCCINPAFGYAADTFRAQNISGLSEGFIPVLDFKQFGMTFGIKLDMGTDQKLVLQINDATDGIDSFNCVAYGFDRFE